MASNKDGIGEEKIQDIAERAKRNEARDKVRTTESGAVEYNFSAGIPETSLVFIDGEEDEAAERNLSVPTEANADSGAEDFEENPVFRFADVPADGESPAPKPRDASTEEFDIPDMFVMSEEYTEPQGFDMAPMIWKTYVPRFTEVTERTYKLRDESSVSVGTAAPAVSDLPSVKAEMVESESRADPATAEIDAGVKDGAVVVNVDGREEQLPKDTINVFKFGGKERIPTVLPSDEERERRDITELTGHVWQDKPEKKDNTETKDEDEFFSPREEISDEKSYSEDKPEDAPYEQIEQKDDDELPESERPLGWNTDILKINASDTGEYNHHSMRESFKDRFLDGLLSLRIRMVVSAVLTLVALVFEGVSLFGVNALSLIGLADYPTAHPLLEGALILAMLIIALPETLRALRYLAKGRVLPELSLPLGAVLLLSYTTVVAAKLPSSYLCFGFIYGTMTFLAVFANYCLQTANFEVFKRTSDSGNKTVVDNRLTRTLERENISLDGAVDEYKSRCARRFKTSFVQDFFASSAKDAENQKNNLLLLALSFGIGIVVGVIMYFLGGGILSALSSASLVIMLSTPAFSFTTHKLTLLFAEGEAISHGSAFIGEASLFDYSLVDCVTFEDSEVIGRDDVSFKSISLSDRQGDLRYAMRQMASLFASVGGALGELFSSSLGGSFSGARDVEIETDGVSGIIDGSRVMAGSFDYMRRHGVRVVPERGPYVESTKIMYGAEDGVLFAKFSIQYNFSEEFALSLSEMRENGITALVYTRDPNLNTELMRFLTGGSDLIRVMKKTSPLPESEKVYKRLTSTLVQFSASGDTVGMCALAKRYKHLMNNMALTELSACAVGAVLASALAMFNMALPVLCPIIGLWQIGWCLAMGIIERKSFFVRKK